MNYCKNCIMPDTRPDQIFNDKGVCNACLSYAHNQKKIKSLIGCFIFSNFYIVNYVDK